MSWTPHNFDEACRRAADRRAYNARRRLTRKARITRIIALQSQRDMTGRELAEMLHVHEATISRDLRFIERVRADYRRTTGHEMGPRSFRFIGSGMDWETTFEIRGGVRVR